jgi:hypothetical protein
MARFAAMKAFHPVEGLYRRLVCRHLDFFSTKSFSLRGTRIFFAGVRKYHYPPVSLAECKWPVCTPAVSPGPPVHRRRWGGKRPLVPGRLPVSPSLRAIKLGPRPLIKVTKDVQLDDEVPRPPAWLAAIQVQLQFQPGLGVKDSGAGCHITQYSRALHHDFAIDSGGPAPPGHGFGLLRGPDSEVPRGHGPARRHC